MSDHEWVEVRVLVPQGWEELVAEALALGPCTSVAFGRSSLASDPLPEGMECVRTFIHVREDTPELRERIAQALAGLARDTGAEELAALSPEFKELPREDYARSWMKVWKPFSVPMEAEPSARGRHPDGTRAGSGLRFRPSCDHAHLPQAAAGTRAARSAHFGRRLRFGHPRRCGGAVRCA
jgi:hypothetical protein